VDLAKRLGRLGYQVTRQTGSHLRLTTDEGGRHHVTIPIMTRSKWEHWLEFLAMSPRISESAEMN
jgi:predicted RNA binding protein YcfA (HicA-like mRNA interferase family)